MKIETEQKKSFADDLINFLCRS